MGGGAPVVGTAGGNPRRRQMPGGGAAPERGRENVGEKRNTEKRSYSDGLNSPYILGDFGGDIRVN
jgi:hypothetical protein